MKLTETQLEEYGNNGFVLLPELFSKEEVDILCEALEEDGSTPGPHLVTEADGHTLRAIYASHLRHPVYRRLIRSDRLLAPVKQLADDELYIHQLKVNVKHAHGGEQWAWHQDFIVWRDADNMPAPRAVNVGIFLDDMNEYNGSLVFLRGSHRLGTLERKGHGAIDAGRHIDPDDYSLDAEELGRLTTAHEMTSPKGSAGSVVLFHPEVIHGSALNISPFPRRLLIATYNPITNEPRPAGRPRPEYLVGRAGAPLVAQKGPVRAN